MVKSNCIHVPCHPQAAPQHLPPSCSLESQTRSLLLILLGSLTPSGGAAVPCSLIFPPQLWVFLVLRYQVIPCSGNVLGPSLGCKHFSQSCCRELLCHVLSVDRARIASIPELNCTEMLVLTHTHCHENTMKSDICVWIESGLLQFHSQIVQT